MTHEAKNTTKGATMASNEIKIGDRVRSWDSMYPERRQETGDFANWVEGVVVL